MKKLTKFLCGSVALLPIFISSALADDLSIEGESIIADNDSVYNTIYIGQTTTDPDAISEFIVNEGVSITTQYIKMANTAESNGSAKLIVKGEVNFSGGWGNFAVRADDNAPGNAANVYIEIGENASLAAGEWFNINGNSQGSPTFTSVDDFTGTLVKWNLSEDGSSGTIYGNNQNCSFSSWLVLDFTKVDLNAGSRGGSTLAQAYPASAEEPGGTMRSDGNTTAYALINGEYYQLAIGGETVIGDITIDLSRLGWDVQDFTYSYRVAVPEPSTYAALFGVLALALAIYRKK